MRTLFLQKPKPEFLQGFLTQQAQLDFTYAAVGATATTPPPGFVVDRTRIDLGFGPEVFSAAKEALRRWQQFQLGWVDAWPHNTPLVPGQVVAVLGRGAGLWWLNACRIIKVVDESGPGPISAFGFSYGTLPSHVARGEERFLVEWNRETDQVSYQILAFSQPNRFLIRLAYPIVRCSQKRFGRCSAAAMFRAVNSAAKLPAVTQSTS